MQQGYQAEKSLGYQQITSLSAATGFTLPTNGSVIYAIVIPETQAVRWRDDGTSPTATVGYPLAVGSELKVTTANMASIKFIEQTASAKINISYYGSLGS